MRAYSPHPLFLPRQNENASLIVRDRVKTARRMASYMAGLAEQAAFQGRVDAVQLWQKAAADKEDEAAKIERDTRGRSVIPDAPEPRQILAILARHGRLGRAE